MNISETLENVISNTIDIGNNISQMQQKFMESKFYDFFDGAVNIGIRAACPDIIEDEIIDMKDIIMQNGLIDGAKEIVNNIKEFGKETLGLLNGNFETISQLQQVIKNGGVLDKISKLFDFALNTASSKGLFSKSTEKSLKSQKNNIVKSIKSDISKDLESQEKDLKKINEYNQKWYNCYKNQDLKGMKNANKNIQKYLKNVLPIENTLKEARKIEMLQNLIENRGEISLSKEELELVETLNNY